LLFFFLPWLTGTRAVRGRAARLGGYAALKAGTGRWREVHPAVALVAGLFVLRYVLE